MDSEWYCFKCKEKMGKADVGLNIFDISQEVEGIKCPKCGKSFLLEEKVVGEIAEQEKMIESK